MHFFQYEKSANNKAYFKISRFAPDVCFVMIIPFQVAKLIGI